MHGHYLLKTEPSDYSFADLARDEETIWDGVANPAALKFLRAMKPADKLVIYETANVRSAVGTARVNSVIGTQGKEPNVKIKVGKLRAPVHDGRDSGVMADTIPAA